MKSSNSGFILLLALIFVSSSARAQDNSQTKKQSAVEVPPPLATPKPKSVLSEIPTANAASDRVDPLAQYFLTGQLVFGISGFSLNLQNQDQTKKIEFDPNLVTTIGVGLSFKDYIGVTASFHAGPETDPVNRGHTAYDDFHFDFDFKNFLVEAQYQRYKGLYVSNTSDIDPTLRSNILEPNMSMQNILLAFTYVFNPKNFSIQAALSRTERQIHSGGSWLLGALGTQTTIENSEGLLPTQIRSSFGADQNITKDRSRTLMVTGGYAYTAVLTDKFATTLLGDLGYGWGDSSFTDPIGTTNLNYSSNTLGLKLVIAYNGDLLISGISIEAQTVFSQTNSIRINSAPVLSQIFFGSRY